MSLFRVRLLFFTAKIIKIGVVVKKYVKNLLFLTIMSIFAPDKSYVDYCL